MATQRANYLFRKRGVYYFERRVQMRLIDNWRFKALNALMIAGALSFFPFISAAHSVDERVMTCTTRLVGSDPDEAFDRRFLFDGSEFFERVDGSWEPYCDKDETMKREKNKAAIRCTITPNQRDKYGSDLWLGTVWLEYLDFEYLETGQKIIESGRMGFYYKSRYPFTAGCEEY